jgi:hypothetical protein
MRFATPPSQDRIDAFQKKLKIMVACLLFVVAMVFLLQASFELWARRGFLTVSGTVDAIVRYDAVWPEDRGVMVSDFFHQNLGSLVDYHYVIGSMTYTGRDTVSNNRPPSNRAVASPAVKKGEVRDVFVSSVDPKISRLPRPLAYPLIVGGALFLVGLFLFLMRNDKTPPYYQQGVTE